MEYKILPAITTTWRSDWRAKIREIDELGLTEVAVFPTGLNFSKDEFLELCGLLGKTKLESVPFVHLHNDMTEKDIDFFRNKYGTKVFNTHSERKKLLEGVWKKYARDIYIENTGRLWNEEEIKLCGGICIDFSHLENDRLLAPSRQAFELEIIKKYKIGCAHLGAIRPDLYVDEDDGRKHYDVHYLGQMSEFDYLKKYPREFFPEIMAVELENSLAEQLKIGEYVRKLIA